MTAQWFKSSSPSLFALIAGLTLVSCSGSQVVGHHHPQFTVTNCRNLEVGMDRIMAEFKFGKPDHIEIGMCGPEGKKFQCMIWRYNMGIGGKYKSIENDNRLYFATTFEDEQGHEQKLPEWSLYQWTLDVVYP